jgi:hypothetical protein
MTLFHQKIQTNLGLLFGAALIAGTACKPRSSELQSDVSRADVGRILDEFDQSVGSNIQGAVKANMEFLTGLDPDQGKDLFFRYLGVTERSEDGVPKYWDKHPVFKLDRSTDKRNGFVVPRSITYKVRLPNNQVVPVQVIFQYEDILRSSIWIRNLLAQASGCYWYGGGRECPAGSGQKINGPAPKVRLAVAGDKGIIGFNFINHPSDWQGSDVGLASTTESAPGVSSSASPSNEATAPAESAAVDSSAAQNAACTDLKCGTGSEISDPKASFLAQLPPLGESALFDNLGFSANTIARASYYVSGLNSSSRSQLWKPEICYGDVFTVMDGPGDVIGSGFGMWLQDIKSPCTPLVNANGQDVLVFGKIGGATRDALYQIARALRAVDDNSQQILQGEVVDVTIEAAGNMEDLTTYSGEIYKLKWDYRGLGGNVSSENVDVDDKEPLAKYLKNASNRANAGRMVQYDQASDYSETLTLVGSAERPEGRPAVGARSLQSDQADLQKRMARVQSELEALKEFERNSSRYLDQTVASLPNMRQAEFVFFQNLMREYEAKVGYESGIYLLEDVRHFTEYFLKIRAQSIDAGFTEIAKKAASAAHGGYEQSEDMLRTLVGVRNAVRFMGMGVPYSQEFDEALTRISNSIKTNRNGIYMWNAPMFKLVSESVIENKAMTLAQVVRQGGRGQSPSLSKNRYFKRWLADWLSSDDYRLLLKEMTGEEPPKMPMTKPDFLIPEPEINYEKFTPAERAEIQDYFERNQLKIYATLDSVLIDFSEPVEMKSSPEPVYKNSRLQLSNSAQFRKCDAKKQTPAPPRSPTGGRGAPTLPSCVYHVSESRSIIGEKRLQPAAQEFKAALQQRIIALSLIYASYGNVLKNLK